MKLFVFDLDFTIWDAGGTWCDCTHPPYVKEADCIFDVDRREIKLYPEVMKILAHLKAKNRDISVASRTSSPQIARRLLEMFEIESYFLSPQIFPGSKLSHFKALQENFDIPYTEMVFFDDEHRNIREVSSLGVVCEYLEYGGINWDVVSPYF